MISLYKDLKNLMIMIHILDGQDTLWIGLLRSVTTHLHAGLHTWLQAFHAAMSSSVVLVGIISIFLLVVSIIYISTKKLN